MNGNLTKRDIFICTHQKVGTHLTKKFVVELMRAFSFHPPGHGIAMGDIGHGTVSWPEVSISQYGKKAFQEKLRNDRDVPRLWYTHCSLDDFPFQLKNNTSKIIHVFRDPRGAAVSQYHFYRYHPMLEVSADLGLDDFIDLFLEGKLYFGDYFLHTRQLIEKGSDRLGPKNVISLKYEDLVDHKLQSAWRISNFLFPNHYLSDEIANLVVQATEFDTMKKEIKKNPQTFHFNPDKFFREGKSLGWKDSLTAEQQKRIFYVAKEKWPEIETYYQLE